MCALYRFDSQCRAAWTHFRNGYATLLCVAFIQRQAVVIPIDQKRMITMYDRALDCTIIAREKCISTRGKGCDFWKYCYFILFFRNKELLYSYFDVTNVFLIDLFTNLSMSVQWLKDMFTLIKKLTKFPQITFQKCVLIENNNLYWVFQ